MLREGIAPVLKGVTDYGDEEIPVYRNAQDVTTENLDGNTFSFFPRNPNGGEADSNYTQVPFSGDYPYDVVGIGFALTHFTLRDDPTISAYPDSLIELVNALSHGRVVLRSDKRREEFLDEHTQQMVTFDHFDYELVGDAANDGFIETVQLRTQAPLRLQEALTIETNEVFELDYELADASAIPSQAQYGTLDQGGRMQLMAMMQVIYDDSQGPNALSARRAVR